MPSTSLTVPSDAQLCAELERKLAHDIPLARAMQLAVTRFDGNTLVMAAPLAPNINDKGCAFGGSLASLLTLAGWGLVVLKLKRVGIACDIYVQDSTIQYLAPVWSDFSVTAALAKNENWEAFLTSLQTRGRGRLSLACRVPLADGLDAATFTARFVAKARSAG